MATLEPKAARAIDPAREATSSATRAARSTTDSTSVTVPPGDPILVLASQSPRRAALLRQAGYRFRTEASAYDERRLLVEPASEVLAHARAKAGDVAARHAGEPTVVLAADTAVVHGGTLLGKPRHAAEAATMLRALSGATHDVLTAFSIVDCLSGHDREGVVRTVVHFRPLADAEITRYVSTGEPLDKAGGYAIQGRGAMLTAGIEGDFSNVVGLPLSAVAIALGSVGVHPVA